MTQLVDHEAQANQLVSSACELCVFQLVKYANQLVSCAFLIRDGVICEAQMNQVMMF